jgi:hypothetical protein
MESEAKKFLLQYREAQREECRIAEQIAELKARAASIGSQPRGEPVQGSGAADKMALVDAAIDKERNALMEARLRTQAVKAEVLKAIDAVGDAKHRQILTYRYICLYSWAKIARKTEYSRDHVQKYIHNEALKKIKVPPHYPIDM